MASSELNRREALRRIALGGAAAAAAPLWVENLLAVADRHAAHRATMQSAAKAAAFVPKALDAHQNQTVIALAELIIPATDTPGATAAKVNEYVDGVLADADAGDRKTFTDGLAWLDARSRQQFGGEFVNATPAQQTGLLTTLSTMTSPGPEDAPGVEFFRAIKGMTITGYYTSEVGIREEIGDSGQMFFTEFKGCTHPEHGAGSR
jgi:hypothetical protein